MSKEVLREIRLLERELARIPDDEKHQTKINELVDELMAVMGFD